MRKDEKDVVSESSTDVLDVVEEEVAVPAPEGNQDVQVTDAVESDVDEKGVPYRNRYEEMRRKFEESQSQTSALLDAVKEMARSQNQPKQDAAPDFVEQYFKKAEELNYPRELAELQLQGVQAMIEANAHRVAPIQRMNVDMMTEVAVDRKIAQDEALAPYRNEMLDILKNTDVSFRATPQAVEQAGAVVFYNHRGDIMSNVTRRAQDGAEKNQRIVREKPTGTSKTTVAKGSGLTPLEENILQQVNSRLPGGIKPLTADQILARREYRKKELKIE